MTQPQLAALLICGSVGLWAWHLAVDRTPVGRHVARTAYGVAAVPFAYRIGPLTAPIVFAPVLLLLGAVFLLPREAAPTGVNLPVIAFGACALWFGAALLWVHLTPRRFLPVWLKQEIDSGAVAEASPDTIDWIYAAVPIVGSALAVVFSLWRGLRGG